MYACHDEKITSAGDVDGPLKVLLSENNACCSGLGLRVLFPRPLQPHCWRDKVPLLGPDRQEKWDGMPHIQRHFSILRERHIFCDIVKKVIVLFYTYYWRNSYCGGMKPSTFTTVQFWSTGTSFHFMLLYISTHTTPWSQYCTFLLRYLTAIVTSYFKDSDEISHTKYTWTYKLWWVIIDYANWQHLKFWNLLHLHQLQHQWCLHINASLFIIQLYNTLLWNGSFCIMNTFTLST